MGYDNATGRCVHQIIPKVSEKRTWTAPMFNCTVMDHVPYRDYLHRFRVKPVRRGCPFCQNPNPATSKHILVDCPGTQALRKKYCPKMTISTVKSYFVSQMGRNAFHAMLQALAPKLDWFSLWVDQLNYWPPCSSHTIRALIRYYCTVHMLVVKNYIFLQ